MASVASFRKHPIHPMLIPFPIALWIFSLACDVIYALEWGGQVWNDMAFYSMAAGLLGAAVAAIPGYIDFRSLSDTAVRKIGRRHMLINLTIVALFIVNLWLRMQSDPAQTFSILLSIVAVALLGLSGWLGGELVYVHGVAVERQSKGSPEARERMGSLKPSGERPRVLS
jgi:uncharacterized membrane protein